MSQGRVNGSAADAATAYDIRDDIYDAEDTLQQQQQQHQEEEEEEEEQELRAAAQRLEDLLNPISPPSTTPLPIFPPLPMEMSQPLKSLPLPPASARGILAALQVECVIAFFCCDFVVAVNGFVNAFIFIIIIFIIIIFILIIIIIIIIITRCISISLSSPAPYLTVSSQRR